MEYLASANSAPAAGTFGGTLRDTIYGNSGETYVFVLSVAFAGSVPSTFPTIQVSQFGTGSATATWADMSSGPPPQTMTAVSSTTPLNISLNNITSFAMGLGTVAVYYLQAGAKFQFTSQGTLPLQFQMSYNSAFAGTNLANFSWYIMRVA